MSRLSSLFLILPVLVLVLVPALSLGSAEPALAHGQLAASEKRFTIEVSRNGFRIMEGPVHQMKGETHLAISQGDQVTITFLYADADFEKNNPHRIAISRMRVDSGILDTDNPRRTITFTARREGEAIFRCVKLCEGHKKLQAGKLMVTPIAGAVAAQQTRLALDVPTEASRGQEIAVAAVLMDATGNPVQDEPVRFLVSADFFVQDWMEVGEAMTDSSGVAVISYRPAQRGDLQLRVSFSGDSAYLASEASADLQLGETARLYHAEGGLAVPNLGPKAMSAGGGLAFRVPPAAALALTLLLLAIWGTYLLVITLVYQISREP